MSERRRRPLERLLPLPSLRRAGPVEPVTLHEEPSQLLEGSFPDPGPSLAPEPGVTCPLQGAQLDPAVIRRSLNGMTASPQKLAGDFYGYLFAVSPHLRGMFPPQMTGQNERLFAALMRIVQLLDSPDSLARYLANLGRDHRKYGVTREHYPPVGRALLSALRRHCPAWTEPAAQAWTAAYEIASDAMIAGAETASGPFLWRGTVIRHEMRARDLAVLELRTDAPLEFEPGQYVTVQHRKWHRVWRQFSVANAADLNGDRIELHIRLIPGGWVSTAMVRDTRIGDEVLIGPPAGTMTTEGINGRDLVLIAGGTGLAPLKAVAEDILGRDEAAMAGGWGHRRNIALFHGARTPLDLYDMPALHEMERTWPWLQVHPVVSGDSRYPGLRGPVSDVALSYDGWAGRDVFIAGPPEMTGRTVSGFRRAGTAAGQVHYDDPAAR